MSRHLLLFFLLLSAAAARADRGALSVDVAAAGSVVAVSALQVEAPYSTLSFDFSAWLGVRYALSNHVELSATGFFEPPVPVFQNDVRLVTDASVYPGTTRHQFMRYGAQAGARLTLGMRFRFVLGLELGWAQHAYSELAHFDTSNPESAVNYGLALPDASLPHFALSPLIGVEWAAGDQWSLSILPRAQLLLGSTFSWAVIAPLQFSWSWYL